MKKLFILSSLLVVLLGALGASYFLGAGSRFARASSWIQEVEFDAVEGVSSGSDGLYLFAVEDCDRCASFVDDLTKVKDDEGGLADELKLIRINRRDGITEEQLAFLESFGQTAHFPVLVRFEGGKANVFDVDLWESYGGVRSVWNLISPPVAFKHDGKVYDEPADLISAWYDNSK